MIDDLLGLNFSLILFFLSSCFSNLFCFILYMSVMQRSKIIVFVIIKLVGLAKIERYIALGDVVKSHH